MKVTEAIIMALFVQSKGIEIEVEAMKANDRSSPETGAGCYTEDSYMEKAKALFAISKDIQELARSGVL